MLIVLAGLPEPKVNLKIYENGRVVAGIVTVRGSRPPPNGWICGIPAPCVLPRSYRSRDGLTLGEPPVTIKDAPEVLSPVHAPAAVARSSGRGVTVLFATTAFVGAGLLFVVQPMIAKLILPSYGGSATVWSTSSLFFQVLLLAAYGYAHLSTRRLGRWQPRAHLVVLLLPLVALPVAVPSDAAPSPDASPVLWLLRTLVLVIGLPFLVVATTGPLLQRWYSWGDTHRAHDPYFLFAASNLGSFGGLLAYPFLIEPTLSLDAQRTAWSIGFGVFVVLTGTCALSVRGRAPADDAGVEPAAAGPGTSAGLTRRQVLTWTGLAFLPSSLMLGVTAHITTDIAAIPLLWVVPLAIYLATFVVAFARTTRMPPLAVTRVAVASAFVIVVGSLASGAVPVVPAVAANLLMLALVGYAAHARLAAERPPAEHLTAFYLVVATGGALGGLLNGLVAPMLFDRVWEYPLALMAVPLLLVGLGATQDSWLLQQLKANRVRAALVVSLIVMVPLSARLAIWLGVRGTIGVTLLLVVTGVLGWWIAQVPRALVLGLVLVFALSAVGESRTVIEQSRTFFGSYTVHDRNGVHELVNGTTVHGRQLQDSDRRDVPTTYYSRTGPLGQVFELRRYPDVAAVGLGTGTVAAYGVPGQRMRFYEIDAEVVRVAEDPRLFTFVADSAAQVETVVGDGRLELAKEPPGSMDLVILDAFTSDSIPVHLLTEEAIRLYVDRLAPDGLLMVHISNRVFDLEPVLASAADRLGLAAAIGRGGASDVGVPSVWVALSRDSSQTRALLGENGWRGLGPERVRWTDDYSSILSVFR